MLGFKDFRKCAKQLDKHAVIKYNELWGAFYPDVIYYFLMYDSDHVHIYTPLR